MAETTAPAVRRARPDDVDAIVALGEAVVPVTYGHIDPAYARLMLESWWARPRLADSLASLPHWVAVDGDRVVGVANLGEREGRPMMFKLYTHPDVHGAGIGSALLHEVVEAAGGPGLDLEVVEGNERALSFYQRHGFVEVDRYPEPAYPTVALVALRRDAR